MRYGCKWHNAMRVEFLNRMQLSEVARVDNGKRTIYWQTDNSFYCVIFDADLNEPIELIVPKYFFSDLTSVPRLPFAYLLFADIGRRAGLVHDALYSPWPEIKAYELSSRQPYVIQRAWADQVLYAALISCGVSAWKARLMWLAVKTMGSKYFHCKPVFEHGIPYYEPY